jgi:hypothetical protein
MNQNRARPASYLIGPEPKPRVLYAPSDYSNEANFIRMMEPATVLEVAAKVDAEIVEAASAVFEQPQPLNPTPPPGETFEPAPSPSPPQELRDQTPSIVEDVRGIYALGEAKAFSQLAAEFPRLQRDVAFRADSKRIIFDGIAEGPDASITLFEIKVRKIASFSMLREVAATFAHNARLAPLGDYKRIHLIIIVVVRENFERTRDLPRSIPVGDGNFVEVRYMQY